MNIDPKKIVSVSVAPCTAKKAEIRRPEQNNASRYTGEDLGPDTDICITTREFAQWIREAELDFAAVEDSAYDKFIGAATGGGVIFGNTGGVMEDSDA